MFFVYVVCIGANYGYGYGYRDRLFLPSVPLVGTDQNQNKNKHWALPGQVRLTNPDFNTSRIVAIVVAIMLSPLSHVFV